MLQIRNRRVTLSRNRDPRKHQSLVALYAKAATGCGNAVSLKKRPPRREPRSWLRQSSVSLVRVINVKTSKSNAGTSRPSTGQQQPSKTTTLSSVTDVKGLLQVTELKLTNSSGTSTTALVLCDTACSNSWVYDSLAARLGLQGTALKLTIKGINTEDLIDTKVVQLTVTPHEDQDFEAFTVRPYVRETLNVGSDIIDVKSMQEIYPHLAILDPVRYSYG